ncbi:hypothetical protein PR202_gb04742 [Eleusine coracana subsp. coracana]|uniref:Uncharacterized protein n=1 Tax=Eleusine coracana subsp. coracana TaxID=191504 RepID=A0AAV5E620_ELECO|nr:hypothetical protein PR202_gb04742 [Eleusine coracana subsp. coracana]
MGRYGPFRIASGDGRGCLPLPIVVSEAVLAVVDGAIAAAAFVQVGDVDLKISFSLAIVFLAYFVSTIIATCQRWICWVHGCGFVLMGTLSLMYIFPIFSHCSSPQILHLFSFLLLLSFWHGLGDMGCWGHHVGGGEKRSQECTEQLSL